MTNGYVSAMGYNISHNLNTNWADAVTSSIDTSSYTSPSELESVEEQCSEVLLYNYFRDITYGVGQYHIVKYYKESKLLEMVGNYIETKQSERHKMDLYKKLYKSIKNFIKQNQIEDIRNVDPVVLTILKISVLK